uniref:Uncharacterized protein n=1 Tax=Anguilla anguilla TaxID=7936 RepID=A0A0E9RP78_ANGAN
MVETVVWLMITGQTWNYCVKLRVFFCSPKLID